MTTTHMTSRSYHVTPDNEAVCLVRTNTNTDLSMEVYTVTASGLEMYRGTLIEEPHWAYLLAEVDGDRRGWTYGYPCR